MLKYSAFKVRIDPVYLRDFSAKKREKLTKKKFNEKRINARGVCTFHRSGNSWRKCSLNHQSSYYT